MPLRGKETPEIAVLDPLNASVMYLAVGEHSVVVNIRIGEVIGSSLLQFDGDHFVPCVLPPWLGSSRIPSAGKRSLLLILSNCCIFLCAVVLVAVFFGV